ncbi:MAG TPA: YeeE/YedE thiosulfate transporter family protein [Chitinophagales bacterium]|nr:YeeE/YedE thiosulfate transporter family protein [Chitinophagales bacterium]HRK28851.1 YeeE/YedE thiosulfate transporter family protein [Chitinophagales bacterium]
MKLLKFFLLGILFGIIMTKSEVISWFRIQEMFRFQSFHMYGVIGTAVGLGVIIVALIKKFKLKNNEGAQIVFNPKAFSIPRYLFGGIIFGLGWALTGACPGPIFVLIGNGYVVFIAVALSALLGTFTYGLLRDKLPH